MSKAEEDFQRFAGLAEELGLDEQEAEGFIASSMKRLGHRPKLSWEDADTSNEGGSGDFFSSITGGKRRESRPTGPQRRKPSGDWQYGRSA